jgi:glycosyltransferase involved in cell wall biosynthesis
VKPRRLLALLPAGGLAGVQRTHVEMAVALRARGWDVQTVIPGPPNGLDQELSRHGLPHLGIPRITWALQTARQAPITDVPSGEAYISELLHDLRPDVALTQSSVTPQLAVAARESSVPHVWYVHEFGDLDHGLELPASARDWGAFMLEHSSTVMCNSTAVRGHFFPGHPEVAVLPYVVEMPSIDQHPVPDVHGARVGLIGTLQEGKGQHLAIQALHLIHRHVPHATLHLFGSGTPGDLLRLKRLSKQLGVKDAVIFHGFVDDRSLIFGSIDVTLVASRAEAYGRVPDEAALAGIPVVYVASGGLPERLRDEEGGLQVATPTPEAVADAIIRIVESVVLRQKLADNALRALQLRQAERNIHDELDAILRGLTSF